VISSVHIGEEVVVMVGFMCVDCVVREGLLWESVKGLLYANIWEESVLEC